MKLVCASLTLDRAQLDVGRGRGVRGWCGYLENFDGAPDLRRAVATHQGQKPAVGGISPEVLQVTGIIVGSSQAY
jgi:hypothetical protein